MKYAIKWLLGGEFIKRNSLWNYIKIKCFLAKVTMVELFCVSKIIKPTQSFCTLFGIMLQINDLPHLTVGSQKEFAYVIYVFLYDIVNCVWPRWIFAYSYQYYCDTMFFILSIAYFITHIYRESELQRQCFEIFIFISIKSSSLIQANQITSGQQKCSSLVFINVFI